jgi:hypothetical protein
VGATDDEVARPAAPERRESAAGLGAVLPVPMPTGVVAALRFPVAMTSGVFRIATRTVSDRCAKPL